MPSAGSDTAAVYARRSKKGARSVTEQTELGIADCKKNDWPIHDVYRDNRSASRFESRERDDWGRLLADLRESVIGILWLWDSSRGSRDLVAWSAMLAECRRLHVRIHIHTHDRTYDLSKRRDWKTLAEDGVDNADESEKISERTLRAAEAAAVSGRPWGSVTYGYQRVYDPKTGVLLRQIPLAGEADIVHEITRRRAAGEPSGRIAADLNERGVPSPNGGTWHSSVVRGISVNPAYIGKRSHLGQLYEASWDAIVSETQQRQAAAWLHDPARYISRPGGTKYLLSCLALCGECGTQLRGKLPGSNRHRSPFYKCNAGGCVACGMAPLDDYVREVITGLAGAAGPGLIMLDDTAAAEAEAEADQLQARLDAHALMSARGELGSGSSGMRALAIITAELEPRIAAARRRAEQLSAPPLPFDPRKGWKEAPMYAQKEVVRSVLASISGRIEVKRAARGGRVTGGDPMDYSRVRISGMMNGEPFVIQTGPAGGRP